MLNPGKYQHQQHQYKPNLNTLSTCTGLLVFPLCIDLTKSGFPQRAWSPNKASTASLVLQAPCLPSSLQTAQKMSLSTPLEQTFQ